MAEMSKCLPHAASPCHCLIWWREAKNMKSVAHRGWGVQQWTFSLRANVRGANRRGVSGESIHGGNSS